MAPAPILTEAVPHSTRLHRKQTTSKISLRPWQLRAVVFRGRLPPVHQSLLFLQARLLVARAKVQIRLPLLVCRRSTHHWRHLTSQSHLSNLLRQQLPKHPKKSFNPNVYGHTLSSNLEGSLQMMLLRQLAWFLICVLDKS